MQSNNGQGVPMRAWIDRAAIVLAICAFVAWLVYTRRQAAITQAENAASYAAYEEECARGVISDTRTPAGTLRSVMHDGHMWVVVAKASPVHHPDCAACAARRVPKPQEAAHGRD